MAPAPPPELAPELEVREEGDDSPAKSGLSADGSALPQRVSPHREHVPPTSAEFLARLLRGQVGCPTDSERLDIEAAIAAEEPLNDAAGMDEVARVLAYFVRQHGGDARTLRTMTDVLLRLQPPLSSAELLVCLTALASRFAPVALVAEAGAGRALVRLCQLFEQLLLFHDPQVAFLLRRARLGAEMYCAPWLLTAHAAGLAEPAAALQVWEGWLDRGEPLDPVFLGLARLTLCHDELLLCGPVPELAQVLQQSLGARQHAQPRVVGAALQRASELKAATPLTFLRQLQEALLRVPAEESDVSSWTVLPPAPQPEPAPPLQASPTSLAARAARAAAWLPGRWQGQPPQPGQGRQDTQRPQDKAVPLVCMRVEPQDVLMMETVKERHLKKAAMPGAEGGSPPAEAGENVPDGCRLLPKLIDVRPPAEARVHGVKGSMGVDVSASRSASEFIIWALRRETEAAAFGLRPLHVLMTAQGFLNAEQQLFVTAILEHGVGAVCVLGGGYESLKPFFIDTVDGSDQRVLAEKAQEAKELLQQGLGNLRSLWQKAPSRQQVWGRVARERTGRPGGYAEEAPATFERAPLPPDLAAAAEAIASTPAVSSGCGGSQSAPATAPARGAGPARGGSGGGGGTGSRGSGGPASSARVPAAAAEAPATFTRAPLPPPVAVAPGGGILIVARDDSGDAL